MLICDPIKIMFLITINQCLIVKKYNGWMLYKIKFTYAISFYFLNLSKHI